MSNFYAWLFSYCMWEVRKTNKRTCQDVVRSVFYSSIDWQKKGIKPLYMRMLGLWLTEKLRPRPEDAGGIENASKCFPFTLRRKNTKKQPPIILDFCLSKTREGKYRTLIFEPVSFSKCSLFTLKREAGVSKFFRFDELFRKAPFSLTG